MKKKCSKVLNAFEVNKREITVRDRANYEWNYKY